MPVYSAYRFYGHARCGRRNWFIEPQLDDVQGGNDMTSESRVQNPGTNQALNGDYSVTVPTPDKGHLVPVYHANTQSCADATFTLTNAAPQNPTFNRGRWRVTEKKVADFLTANCLSA
ncbi:endonuclease domain-containing 1 protein-like, partial [Clarias magur]